MTAEDSVILQADGLCRTYALRRGPFAAPLLVKAVDGVSLTLRPGKTLAVVGESGCGKSTLARVVTMIEPPTAGKLVINERIVVEETWLYAQSVVNVGFATPLRAAASVTSAIS